MDIAEGKIALDALKMSELIVAIWRTQRRAKKHSECPEPVTLACETTMDRLRDLGIEVREHSGEPFDDSMKVRVVDEVNISEGAGQLVPRIKECLSPAIYFEGNLIRRADVIVEK